MSFLPSDSREISLRLQHKSAGTCEDLADIYGTGGLFLWLGQEKCGFVPARINEIIIVQCFHLLWIWQWWGEWAVKSIISPLNPDLQTLFDCPVQNYFRAVLMAVPCVGQGMHSEGLPSSLCHDQLFAQRTAEQCKVSEVWDFSLEQRVLKQGCKNKCLYGKF